MTRQIEQLKEEIQKKDKALVKEHFEHKKIERETAACREGLAAVQHSLAQVRFCCVSGRKAARVGGWSLGEGGGE
jgi:hypothetical protein